MKLKLFTYSAIVAGILCSLSSCYDDVEYVYVQNKSADYKTALSALDWGTDTVYAVGHLIPDVDATCSAIAYADLMQNLGYKCAPRIAGDINREMAYLKDYFSITIPQKLDTVVPQQRIILTDHSEYAQAVKGMNMAQVIQIIDHHSLGDVCSSKPLYCKVLPIGSTCSIVYTSYQDLNVKITDDVAKVLLSGILSDTRNLSKTHTDIDSVALRNLAMQLKLDSVALDSINRQMVEAGNSYYGMTDREIFLSDYKDYNIEGKQMGVASLDWYDDATMDNFLIRMHNVAKDLMAEKEYRMMFAKVDRHIPNTDPTSVERYIDAGSYVIYHGDGAKIVAEAIYGPSVGESWVYSKVKLSRKTDLMPAITEVLKSLK